MSTLFLPVSASCSSVRLLVSWPFLRCLVAGFLHLCHISLGYCPNLFELSILKKMVSKTNYFGL